MTWVTVEAHEDEVREERVNVWTEARVEAEVKGKTPAALGTLALAIHPGSPGLRRAGVEEIGMVLPRNIRSISKIIFHLSPSSGSSGSSCFFLFCVFLISLMRGVNQQRNKRKLFNRQTNERTMNRQERTQQTTRTMFPHWPVPGIPLVPIEVPRIGGFVENWSRPGLTNTGIQKVSWITPTCIILPAITLLSFSS